MNSLPRYDRIALEVRGIIADHLRLSLDDIELDRRLDVAELGVDSLALIKLNVVLEERFDVILPELIAADATAIPSVRQVVDVIAERAEGGVS